MEKKKVFIAFVGALLFSIVYGVLSTIELKAFDKDIYIPLAILNTIAIFLHIALIGGLGYVLFRNYFSRASRKIRRRAPILFILFILGASLIAFILFLLSSYVFLWLRGEINDMVKFMNTLREYPSIVLGNMIRRAAVWTLAGSVFLFYMLWRQTINREQQLREENLTFRYRTLKTQVNPHFLFNSLNTLSELVYVDARKADNYIQKLSGIYRYILDHEEVDLVPLKEELEFVKRYFDLQQERSINKMELTIDVREADTFRIVPISLQLLIENALKHNTASEEKPLKIHIYNKEGGIVVSNNLQRKNILNDSSGTGLSNLRERVKLITKKEVTIHESNNEFSVEVPIIEDNER